MKDVNNYRDKIYSGYLKYGFGTLNSTKFDKFYNSYDCNYYSFLPKNKDAIILDVGCGMGHFLYYLKKKGYSNFYGIDIGREQVDFCKKNITEHVEQVSNLVDYFSEKKEQFDAVVMNDVLEHFKKKEVFPVLNAIQKILKNKGVLIIKTCNMGNIFSASSRYIDFTHEVGFTEVSIVQILNASGFSNVQCIEEKLFINSIIKRPFFNLARYFYKKILKTVIFIDRPGDEFPSITSKNLIAVAEK